METAAAGGDRREKNGLLTGFAWPVYVFAIAGVAVLAVAATRDLALTLCVLGVALAAWAALECIAITAAALAIAGAGVLSLGTILRAPAWQSLRDTD